VVVWFDGRADGWPPLLRAYTPDLIFGLVGVVLLWCSVNPPDRRQPIMNDRNVGNAAVK
jgi:hypothetical protein